MCSITLTSVSRQTALTAARATARSPASLPMRSCGRSRLERGSRSEFVIRFKNPGEPKGSPNFLRGRYLDARVPRICLLLADVGLFDSDRISQYKSRSGAISMAGGLHLPAFGRCRALFSFSPTPSVQV